MAILKIQTMSKEQVPAGTEDVEVTVRQTLADLYSSQTSGAGLQMVNAMMNAVNNDIAYYSSDEVGYVPSVVSFVTQDMRDCDPMIDEFMVNYG